MGMDELDKIDKEWGVIAPAKSGGGGNYEPIPEGEKVKVVVVNQRPAIVGQKETPVVKVEFEVFAPEKHKGKKIWHDLWLTMKNLPYLKRDLGTLGWKGTKPTDLLREEDSSLMCLGAEVTTGAVEEYTAKTGEAKRKTTIAFFNAPADAPKAAVEDDGPSEEDIPF